MPRHYEDDDESRLPEGMKRIGYDADTQTYSYRDTADNSIWEGQPGNRYGRLHCVSRPHNTTTHTSTTVDSNTCNTADDDLNMAHEEGAPFLPAPGTSRRPQDDDSHHWRRQYMPLLNFFLLIFLFLAGVFWMLQREGKVASDREKHREEVILQCPEGWGVGQVRKEDTCWNLADGRGITVEELMRGNVEAGVDCDVLRIGMNVCLPVEKED